MALRDLDAPHVRAMVRIRAVEESTAAVTTTPSPCPGGPRTVEDRIYEAVLWVMTSREYVAIRKLKDTQNRYQLQPDPTRAGGFTLFGHPVLVTNRAPNTAGTPVTGNHGWSTSRRSLLPPHLARYAQPGPDGLVFVGPRGGALNASNFTAGAWKEARQVVGMPDLHFHDLRHSACQFGAATRPTEVQLMARMGQSSPTMVRRYQWPTVEAEQEIARRMGETITMARVTQLPSAKAEPS